MDLITLLIEYVLRVVLTPMLLIMPLINVKSSVIMLTIPIWIRHLNNVLIDVHQLYINLLTYPLDSLLREHVLISVLMGSLPYSLIIHVLLNALMVCMVILLIILVMRIVLCLIVDLLILLIICVLMYAIMILAMIHMEIYSVEPVYSHVLQINIQLLIPIQDYANPDAL